MRKFLVLLAACLPVMMAIGCSEEEIVRVGTPFNDEGTMGAEFNTGFTDSETISELRAIIEMEEKIEPPTELAPVPVALEDEQEFYALNKEQTKELKCILE